MAKDSKSAQTVPTFTRSFNKGAHTPTTQQMKDVGRNVARANNQKSGRGK